jgi:hypothetical protein
VILILSVYSVCIVILILSVCSVCIASCILDPINFPSKTSAPYADGSMHYSSILIAEGQSNGLVSPLSSVSPMTMPCLASADEITQMVRRTFSNDVHTSIQSAQALAVNPTSGQIAPETVVSTSCTPPCSLLQNSIVLLWRNSIIMYILTVTLLGMG